MDFLKQEKIILKNSVHAVLAHSYAAYFIAFLLGLFLHFVFPIKIYEQSFVSPIGFIFLFVGTIVVFWAQNTSRKLDTSNLSKEVFLKGPYRYTRTPTQYGLLSLIFGFGFLMNSLNIVLLAILSFILGKFFFIKKQESLLSQKHGSHYLEYKKTVKF